MHQAVPEHQMQRSTSAPVQAMGAQHDVSLVQQTVLLPVVCAILDTICRGRTLLDTIVQAESNTAPALLQHTIFCTHLLINCSGIQVPMC